MKMKRDKTGAMEMTVGTIVTIVLLMSALVLGLILTKIIFVKTTENIKTIDDQVKGEINDLFAKENTKLMVGLGADNTVTIRQGTDNFGVPFGFSPDDPTVWGTNDLGCKYTIAATNQQGYCIGKGWTDPASSIITGTTNVRFDQVDANNGYALLKISVPKSTPACLQRFTIRVDCVGYPEEQETGYFDLNVIKKGLF